MGKQKNTEQFINDAKKVHGNKYDYSKTVYVKALEKVTITCHCLDKNGNEHGDFLQTPNSHLYGRGCPKCGLDVAGKKISKATSGKPKCHIVITQETMEGLFRSVHGDKYDYSKSVYTYNTDKILIGCPKHGEFEMRPYNHYFNKQGCPKCAIEARIKSKVKDKDYFLQKAKEVHGNFYNYDNAKYIGARKKITITCPIHGDFDQLACNHLKGCGCPKCNQSTLEKEVGFILEESSFDYISQCGNKHFPWINNQKFDFYIPKYNIAIECQGGQHFKPTTFFGGEEEFIKIIERDTNKFNLSKEHGVRILYYTHEENTPEDYFDKIYKNKDDLLNEIKKYA